jgi:hypothetical protein
MSQQVRELRFAGFPDGHLPPPVPDPTLEQQEAEWERLRHRLLHTIPAPARSLLLGQVSAKHLEAFTDWIAPFCAPSAAGPNTHLALMLFERIALVIDPALAQDT